MTRIFVLLLVSLLSIPAQGQPAKNDAEAPLAEKFLHEGEFAKGESASLRALEENRDDDEVRFGLGVIQVMRAAEKLGQSLYEYGAVSEKANQPFLRLPVPKNPDPSSISHKELGRVLDAFASDLQRAEATLAAIKDDRVKLRLRLSKIRFDFAGNGKDQTTLLELLVKLNGERLGFEKANPDFRVHFDRGDVAWLRSYCHVLSAMVEAYRSIDQEAGFSDRVESVFPNVEASTEDDDWRTGVKVVDPPRLRRARLHLVAVCELNRESWMHIRAETDDDFEWLPHPRQIDQLGLPLTDERIDAWLEMMTEWEELFKGRSLIAGNLVRYVIPDHDTELGLNVKKLMDDPPENMFNHERLAEDGIDKKYLEDQKGKDVLNLRSLFNVWRIFDGPLGFAYAARMN